MEEFVYSCIDMLSAASNGDQNRISTLLRAGADVNISDTAGLTALMCAAREGHDQCVNMLLAAGADVNGRNEHGQTALMKAADRGRQNCIGMLLNAGANANTVDNFNRTALVYSVMNEHVKCVEELIKAGAGVNACTGFQILLPKLPLTKSKIAKIRKHIRIGILLYSAGEKMSLPIRASKPLSSLNHLCRDKIRKILLNVDPSSNLFGRIPQLGLPSLVNRYLLYNVSLDEKLLHEFDQDDEIMRYFASLLENN